MPQQRVSQLLHGDTSGSAPAGYVGSLSKSIHRSPPDLLALISGGADALQRPSLHFLRLPHPRTSEDHSRHAKEIPLILVSDMPCLFLPYIQASASSILEVQAVNPEAHRSWFLEGDEIVSGPKCPVSLDVLSKRRWEVIVIKSD